MVQVCSQDACLETASGHRFRGIPTPAVRVQMVCSCAWVCEHLACHCGCVIFCCNG